jgi:hypothetical protein
MAKEDELPLSVRVPKSLKIALSERAVAMKLSESEYLRRILADVLGCKYEPRFSTSHEGVLQEVGYLRAKVEEIERRLGGEI